jgi:hypothetical protein
MTGWTRAAAALGLMAATGAVAALPAATPPQTAARAQAAAVPPRPRPAAFAADLADRKLISGPGDWTPMTADRAWLGLANAGPEGRQAARWAYAISLVGRGRGQEARAVLTVMLADEPALATVDAFRLALGAADAQGGNARRALVSLQPGAPVGAGLAANPEACAWRLWALAMTGQAAAALAEVPCARPALAARTVAARHPFLMAGAAAALAAGRPAPVKAWLAALPDADPAANLMRGKSALALGDARTARLRFARAARDGRPQQRIDAEISKLEMTLAHARATPAMLTQIDQLAFVWRGDERERRALRLAYRSGRDQGDVVRALRSGAALVRHAGLGAELPPLLVEVQALLAASLAPTSRMPIAVAAGLYWEYRDLAPAGAAGDYLASALADRLEARGLYGRAAELLRHQLLQRTADIAQGPLSARVARLFILAGDPEAALAAIRATDTNDYPADMRWDRNRMAAVALYKLGRRAEALAVVQDVPEATAIRSEIHWQDRAWAALIAEAGPRLPAPSKLTGAGETIVMRQAIALAMLGRETQLADMRARYLKAFAGSPRHVTFDMLTRDLASVDAETLQAAMLAIPDTSPAGDIANLFAVPIAAPRLAVRPRVA